MRIARAIAPLALVALLATACGGGAAGGTGPSGTVDIDGSSTVGPITEAIAEELFFENPDITVNLGVSGTGGGFERFCSGETDISNASRPIKDEERERCAANGVEFVEVRVGTDALTMVVSPEMEFVDCLTTAEVEAIFGPDDPATNWSEVREGFPDRDLIVFGPDADSGTYDFMVEDVLDLEGSRQDYQASADDNVVVQGVAGTPGAWGFFGFAYYIEQADLLKALAYDAGDGCVEPSAETAQDGSYAMTRPLFIYVNERSLREEPAVREFVTFYLDAVSDLIETIGFIPAPDDAIEASRQEVQQIIQAGTGAPSPAPTASGSAT